MIPDKFRLIATSAMSAQDWSEKEFRENGINAWKRAATWIG